MFEKNFCSSPWIHMRIEHDGGLQFCRWQDWTFESFRPSEYNLKTTTLTDYFQTVMNPIRLDMLNGVTIPACSQCYLMEQHGKVSGRERQLLKAGVQTDNFEKTLASSPMLPMFEESLDQGKTSLYPIDLQIMMGNYCNGGCVYCHPEYSSKLAQDWKRIGELKQEIPTAWADDPILVDKFVQELTQMPEIKYLHFLGGENMIMPGFKRILQALIKVNLNDTITLGLTTNLTHWNDELIDLLKQFKYVHLGMSIDCIHPVNDYLRYPSKNSEAVEYIRRYVDISDTWLYQIRATQTLFSVYHLDTLLDFAWDNSIPIETCNFLTEPKWAMLDNLNDDLRNQIINKLSKWTEQHQADTVSSHNLRNPSFTKSTILRDANSYIDYLKTMTPTQEHWPEMIRWIKSFESLRGNSILDYLPEYEQFLRTAGY